MPPDATTGRLVRSSTSLSNCVFGPFSMPSRATSVTTYRAHPAARVSRTAHRSPPSLVHRERRGGAGERQGRPRSPPRIDRSPWRPISGFSSAAVPRLTRSAPEPNAASRLAWHCGAQPPEFDLLPPSRLITFRMTSRLEPRSNAASRSTRACTISRPVVGQSIAADSGSRCLGARLPLSQPAGRPWLVSTAGSRVRPGCSRICSRRAFWERFGGWTSDRCAVGVRQGVDPVAQQHCLTDFSGVNWVAESGPFSHRRQKPLAVGRPGQSGIRVGRLTLDQPLAGGESARRAKTLIPDPVEEHRVLVVALRCSSPCAAGSRRAVRQRYPATHPSPRWRCCVAGVEHDLHADADAEHRTENRRASCRRSRRRGGGAAPRPPPRMTDPGDHQTVRLDLLGAQLHRGTAASNALTTSARFRCRSRRPPLGSAHSAPLVDGTPWSGRQAECPGEGLELRLRDVVRFRPPARARER